MFVVECMGWVCEVMVGDVCGVGMWGDGGYVRRWWVCGVMMGDVVVE